MERLRVLLVDDHPLFRQGVRRALELHPAIQVVGEAGDGEAALQQADILLPDLVVCDLNLPRLDGLEVTRTLARRYPNMAVVILTLHQDEAVRARALAAGAAAYLTKGTPSDDLVAVLERIGRGDSLPDERFPRRAPDSLAEPGGSAVLTARERDVLTCIAQGKSNKEIARLLGISDQTVKNHITAILRKLGVNDRTQAVIYALRHGLIAVREES